MCIGGENQKQLTARGERVHFSPGIHNSVPDATIDSRVNFFSLPSKNQKKIRHSWIDLFRSDQSDQVVSTTANSYFKWRKRRDQDDDEHVGLLASFVVVDASSGGFGQCQIDQRSGKHGALDTQHSLDRNSPRQGRRKLCGFSQTSFSSPFYNGRFRQCRCRRCALAGIVYKRGHVRLGSLGCGNHCE